MDSFFLGMVGIGYPKRVVDEANRHSRGTLHATVLPITCHFYPVEISSDNSDLISQSFKKSTRVCKWQVATKAGGILIQLLRKNGRTDVFG